MELQKPQNNINRENINKHNSKGNQGCRQQRKFYVKGSGNSGCLLNGKLDDEIQFIQLKWSNIRFQNIRLSGLFAVGIGQQIIQLKCDPSSHKIQTTENNQQDVISKSYHNPIQEQPQSLQINSCVNQNQKETRLYRWGTFDNQIISKPLLIKIDTKYQIDKISCGWNHALFKTTDSNLLGIGENKYGQLGPHNPNYFHHQPIQVLQNNNVKYLVVSFAAGFRQSYWSTNTNQIYGCGESKNCQLGFSAKINNKQYTNSATLIQYQNIIKNHEKDKEMGQVIKIRCGKRFMILLNKNNEVFGIGSNDYGCLSDKKYKSIQKLTKISSNIKDVQCGWSHIILLDQQGRVLSRGRNNFGQLGRESLKQQQKQKQKQRDEYIDEIKQKCTSIAAGTQFNFGIGQSGKMYGWGWNQHMNLTSQNYNDLCTINKPAVIGIPENFAVQECVTYPAITIIKGIQKCAI